MKCQALRGKLVLVSGRYPSSPKREETRLVGCEGLAEFEVEWREGRVVIRRWKLCEPCFRRTKRAGVGTGTITFKRIT